MDQGIAAVLGAGVGVLGTLGTAALTHMAARRQTLDNGKVQHWQKMRDERKETYLSFLSAVEDFQAEVSGFHASLLPPEAESNTPPISGSRKAAGDCLTKLYGQCNRVGLAGPTPMADQARAVRTTATSAFATLENLRRDGGEWSYDAIRDYNQKSSALLEQQRKFVTEAARVLGQLGN
ncbi:hypothetical protein [Streptomyces violaceusniger]|uniref:hypothetical protein n=1 Tax=Streptomyces violaceusniger TaxID=68280 RepID=UPI00381D1BFF